MKDSVVVGNLEVKPGEIGFGTLDCASLRDSQPVAMPLIMVNDPARTRALLTRQLPLEQDR